MRTLLRAKPQVALRGHVMPPSLCPRSPSFQGWHMSYFMDSARFIDKLRAHGGLLWATLPHLERLISTNDTREVRA